MWRFWLLLTDVPEEKIEVLKRRCVEGEAHPMKVKKELAKRITQDFHGEPAALQAAEDWEKQFQRSEIPEDIETIEILYSDVAASDGKTVKLEKLLHRSGLADSVTDGARKIKAKAVRIGSEVKADSALLVDKFPFDVTIRVGRKLKRILVKR
jgi:tyrosyl-tRNA synthetase